MAKIKRKIHNSGPLGMLIKSGQIEKVDQIDVCDDAQQADNLSENKPTREVNYFKTKSGLEFSKDELIYVDPKECEPWKYANRQEDELGNMDELIQSLVSNKQLQPALARLHPTPHDGIKYEIIFGRRRHKACLKMSMPFLIILKEVRNVQEAIALQDAENKCREDVSYYSNALLYQKLLEDGVFPSQKVLAEKLGMPTSTLNDVMAFIKIPKEIIDKVPNIHKISRFFAIKIVSLLGQSRENYKKLLELSPEFGKTIISSAKLEQLVNAKSLKKTKEKALKKEFISKNGKKLFSFKRNSQGAATLLIEKSIVSTLDVDKVCLSFKQLLEEQI